MSISLKDITDNELIDKGILNTMPEKCVCGAQLICDDSLQKLICQDVQCESELAERFLRFTNDMGQDLWTIQDCLTLIQEKKLVQPFQIFRIPLMIGNGKLKTSVKNIDDKVTQVCDPKHKLQKEKLINNMQLLQMNSLRDCELYQIAEFSEHRHIKYIAKDVFRGLHSIQEAYTYIKLWPVTFIATRLGLKTDDSIKMASEIYNTLINIESELRFGEKYFNVKNNQSITLNLATCQELSEYRTVNEFIDTIEHRYNGKVSINLVPSIYQKLDAYINDFDNFSSKYQKADNLNEQHQLKQLAKHEIKKEDIGKLEKDSTFHAVGEKIFIGDTKKFIERLDKIYG